MEMAANPKGSFENIKQIDPIIPQVQNSQLKYKCVLLRCRVIHIRGSLLDIILLHVISTGWISDLIWCLGSEKLYMYLANSKLSKLARCYIMRHCEDYSVFKLYKMFECIYYCTLSTILFGFMAGKILACMYM